MYLRNICKIPRFFLFQFGVNCQKISYFIDFSLYYIKQTDNVCTHNLTRFVLDFNLLNLN